MTRLTPHFTLEELTVTSRGLPNAPGPQDVQRLLCLCAAVLEPWRERIGVPLRVTSGYRSQAVNDALRAAGYSASSTSQHLLGEAADVQADLVGPPADTLTRVWGALVDLARAGLPVDQAILYQRAFGKGWIHVSHTCSRAPRRELLVQLADGKIYVPWSTFGGPLVTG